MIIIIKMPIIIVKMLLISNVFCVSVLGLETAHFSLRRCKDPDVAHIAQATTNQTRRAISVLACAGACLQKGVCAKAVFLQHTKQCSFIPEDGQGNEEDIGSTGDATSDNCTVLLKSQNSNPVPEEHILWDLVSPENLVSVQDLEFETFKLVTHLTNQRYIAPVSNIFHDQTGNLVITANSPYLLSVAEQGDESMHPNLLKFVYSTDSLATTTEIFVDNAGKVVMINAEHTSFIIQRMPSPKFSDTGMVVKAESMEELRAGLLKGYRRVSRNPSRSHIFHDDIIFDMAEIFTMDSAYERETAAPGELYFTSIKESFMDGKRNVSMHKVNNGTRLPIQLIKTEASWGLDASWRPLKSGGLLETQFDVLVFHLLQGKWLRLVMGGEISTDVTSIRHSANDLIVSLPPYLVPSTNSVVFSMISASKTLIECEFREPTLYIKTKTDYTKELAWFISTRNWTNVLEMRSDKTIRSGSQEDLYVAVMKGKDVRLCQRGATGGQCFEASSVTTTSDHFVIFTSVLALYGSNNKKGFTTASCYRISRVMSSEGWGKSLLYDLEGNHEIRPSQFQSLLWFVEES